MTIDEAAAARGVTRQTIHAAVSKGRIPARVLYPPGGARGRWLIKRADLDAWQPAMTQEEKAKRPRPSRRKDGA